MKRCGNCGSKELSLVNLRGRPHQWVDYPAVYLLEDVNVLECQHCGNLVLSSKDIDKISDACEGSIKAMTHFFIEKIVEREQCSQVDLAAHLGITPQYLATIKSGKKIPKFNVFNFLKTLAFSEKSFKVSDPAYNISKNVASLKSSA